MEFLWRLILPLFLSFVTIPFLGMLDIVISVGVFFTVYIIWLVIINGGFLILDGDLNLFD